MVIAVSGSPTRVFLCECPSVFRPETAGAGAVEFAREWSGVLAGDEVGE